MYFLTHISKTRIDYFLLIPCNELRHQICVYRSSVSSRYIKMYWALSSVYTLICVTCHIDLTCYTMLVGNLISQ